MAEWLVRGLRAYDMAGRDVERWDALSLGDTNTARIQIGIAQPILSPEWPEAAAELRRHIKTVDPRAVIKPNDGRFAIPEGVPPDAVLDAGAFVAVMQT